MMGVGEGGAADLWAGGDHPGRQCAAECGECDDQYGLSDDHGVGCALVDEVERRDGRQDPQTGASDHHRADSNPIGREPEQRKQRIGDHQHHLAHSSGSARQSHRAAGVRRSGAVQWCHKRAQC